MSSLPEQAPLHDPDSSPTAGQASCANDSTPAYTDAPAEQWMQDSALSPTLLAGVESASSDAENATDQYRPPASEQLLFQSWLEPEIHEAVRIPHLGHLGILAVFALFALVCVSLLVASALHFHLYGVSTVEMASTEIHYTLGSEGILYLLTFGLCLLFFPMMWHKSLFAGLQWNGATALRLRRRLFFTASICFVLALFNAYLMPGPTNAPIDKIFRAPGAAWLLFIFGVTFAPLFEEMVFRGFLLPALCTACDWTMERSTRRPAPPLDNNGHPQWSLPAMVVASIVTSIPFAGMHAAQTGYTWGPFFLLVGVSLVLCWTRLSTRSLAASVLVHASYNFLLFSILMLGTGGFRHLENM